jgi:hypothetical protein
MKLKARPEKIDVAAMMTSDHFPAKGTCPHCGKKVMFETLGKDVAIGGSITWGQRRYTDRDCCGHVFVVIDTGKLVATYPAAGIPFETEKIPKTVAASLNEAIECYSYGCYVASAIILRRPLEGICVEYSLSGSNLRDKIQKLQNVVSLPKDLVTGMDVLRLLGNDAAHFDPRYFATISKAELEIAISITKEIVKSLYQYSVLVEKLKAFKKER